MWKSDVSIRKTVSLGAAARWVCSDVLDVPDSLDGSADLVFTGKGALPWILDLEEWPAVVARLLRPGGLFYAFEGHPLAAVWNRDADVSGKLPMSYVILARKGR